ncbi:MAG TPA: DUF2793 domain-containing protein [Hyphomicrobiales bacterium]|nr:DUF2793 domain-containing protein [Hyphomicrobiales bacterium]
MSADATPHLALAFLAEGQQHKEVTVNDALNRLDAVVQLAVIDRDLAAPPASPAEGDRYLVAAGGSGAWAGAAGAIAAFFDGAWTVLAPAAGWLCWVDDDKVLLIHDGTAWQEVGGGTGETLQNLTLLGVGTMADATNPFAAKLNGALWTARTVAEGGSGDLRYVFDKEGAANTGSLLFQTGFAGRAEIGLTGDDDFHFKVSPDGSAWADALVLSRASGAARFPKGVSAGLVLPETQAAIDAMTVTPSRKRQRLYDELVGELLYAGILAKLDALYTLAAHDAQAALVNLADRAFDLAAVNTPAFTTDRGYAGAAGAYLETGFTPGASGQYAQNSAALGVFVVSSPTPTTGDSNAYPLLCTNSANQGFIRPLIGGNTQLAYSVASAATVFKTLGSPTRLGFSAASRLSGTQASGYRDGDSLGLDASSSAALSSGTFRILGNGASAFTPDTVGAVFFGAGLTDAEMATLYATLHDFLAAIGAA